MLANFFFDLIYNLIYGFFSLFPVADLSDSVATSITTASGYLTALDPLIPLGTLVSIIVLVLAIETVMLTIKIINWFIRKIPTIS